MSYIKNFTDTKRFKQEGGENATERSILPESIVGGLQMGLVEVIGPGRTVTGSHSKSEFEQCYIILSGKGYLLINEEKYPIKGRMIAQIPPGTQHHVEVPEGSTLQYIFVNSRRHI